MSAADGVAAVMLASLVLYVLGGGADFGGGIWELAARGPRAERQRSALEAAIAPVWEAHHVWLILVVVLLFVCFPVAFSGLMTALHLPMLVMLFGIVLRGSAFVFRAYSAGDVAVERHAGRAFAISSVVSPFMLGVMAGAIASGGLRIDPVSGMPEGGLLAGWLAPFPLMVGAMTVALCAYLAAVYMTVEAREDDLREDFRRRALGAAIALGATALAAAALARSSDAALAPTLFRGELATLFHAVTGVVAVGALAALWTRRYALARGVAVIQAALIVLGWGLAQHPHLVPPDLTIAGAASPDNVLRGTLVVLAGGTLLLAPAFLYLYLVFKSRRHPP